MHGKGFQLCTLRFGGLGFPRRQLRVQPQAHRVFIQCHRYAAATNFHLFFVQPEGFCPGLLRQKAGHFRLSFRQFCLPCARLQEGCFLKCSVFLRAAQQRQQHRLTVLIKPRHFGGMRLEFLEEFVRKTALLLTGFQKVFSAQAGAAHPGCGAPAFARKHQLLVVCQQCICTAGRGEQVITKPIIRRLRQRFLCGREGFFQRVPFGPGGLHRRRRLRGVRRSFRCLIPEQHLRAGFRPGQIHGPHHAFFGGLAAQEQKAPAHAQRCEQKLET